MEEGADLSASGKNERIQWFQIALALVDELLQRFDVGGANVKHAIVNGVWRRGQLAAEVEEFVLQPLQDLLQFRVVCAGIAELRR